MEGASPRPSSRSSLGAAGERAALQTYRSRGYRMVARNWRCRTGELDLVLERGGVLVFCEVKTRSGAAFGGGYEAVTWSKRRKLKHLAELFVRARSQGHARIRFDVASVEIAG